MNGYPSGQGARKWLNGDVYEGTFKNGYQSGQGSFECKEGGWTYSGEWQQGKMNSFGMCKWHDGTQYKGQWRNCVKEGQGNLSYSDGSVYTGNF